MNGPHAGASRAGQCEVNVERDGAWRRIDRRMEALGTLDALREIRPPKEWTKMTQSRETEVTPLEIEDPVRCHRGALARGGRRRGEKAESGSLANS